MTDNVLSDYDETFSSDLRGLAPPWRPKHALLRLWNTYWDYQARRATAVILYALDDRVLADIGVDRSEIESLAFDTSEERMRRFVSR